jgi:hypothetical protein
MDKKTIAEAARMSKRVCNEEGTGNHVIIWTKGYTKEIVEDVLGSDRPWLKTPEGEAIYPELRIRFPMTAQEIEELLAEQEAETSRRGAGEGFLISRTD